MKTLKANRIEKEILSNKEMNQIRGGEDFCGCGCLYEGKGGSSTSDNASANSITGAKSPGEVYKEIIILIDEVTIEPQEPARP